MQKKADMPFFNIKVIMAVMFLLIILIVIWPKLGIAKDFIFDLLGIGEKCPTTDKKMSEYEKEIAKLLQDKKEEEAIALYEEFKNCFPGNNDLDKKIIEVWKTLINKLVQDIGKLTGLPSGYRSEAASKTKKALNFYDRFKKIFPSVELNEDIEYRISVLKRPNGNCLYSNIILDYKKIGWENSAWALCDNPCMYYSKTLCEISVNNLNKCLDGDCTACSSDITCNSDVIKAKGCFWDSNLNICLKKGEECNSKTCTSVYCNEQKCKSVKDCEWYNRQCIDKCTSQNCNTNSW